MTTVTDDRKAAAIAAFPDLKDASDPQWDALDDYLHGGGIVSVDAFDDDDTGASLRVVLESSPESVVFGPDGSEWR